MKTLNSKRGVLAASLVLVAGCLMLTLFAPAMRADGDPIVVQSWSIDGNHIDVVLYNPGTTASSAAEATALVGGQYVTERSSYTSVPSSGTATVRINYNGPCLGVLDNPEPIPPHH